MDRCKFKKFYFKNNLKQKIVLFPARVLIEKGINEFISSSKYLSINILIGNF